LSRLLGNRARPVLRGDRCSNAAVLPDERWFGLLTEKLVRRGVHTSVKALEDDIRAWIDTWNEDPKPFTWTKTADEILNSLADYLARIAPSTGNQQQT
jgi:hypothetical protein